MNPREQLRANPLYDMAAMEVDSVMPPKAFLLTFLDETEIGIVRDLMAISWMRGATWREEQDDN